jgi:hypothetical protein
MPVNDNDLELLSAYLDGELPVVESEGLWRRLAAERDLATELDQMRHDLASRGMSWACFEPDDGAVARVQYQVMRGARRDDVMATLRRVGSVASSVAAILLFGFTVGWMGRGNAMAPNPAGMHSGPQATQIADMHPTDLAQDGKVAKAYPLYDEGGNLLGKIVPTKPFASEEEAQQFMQHLNGFQDMQQGSHDSYVLPAANRF